MTSPTETGLPAEVQRYAGAVRTALADVPADRLEELLEDLEDHLAEVAADGEGSLESRLGPPAEYARELRTASGLPAGEPADRGRPGGAAGWVARVRSVRAVGQVAEFLPELRPAWWILRAWALLAAVDAVFFGSHFPVPALDAGAVPRLVALAAAVTWSIRLGRRARAADRPPGPVSVLLNGALAVLAVIAVVGIAARSASWSPQPASSDSGVPASLVHEDGSPITNIYPYSSTGEPLNGVLLYDQDGRPIDDLASEGDDGAVEAVPGAPPQLGNAFPQQRQLVTWDEQGAPVTVPMQAPTTPGRSAPPTSTSGSGTASPVSPPAAATVPSASPAP